MYTAALKKFVCVLRDRGTEIPVAGAPGGLNFMRGGP